MKKTGIFRRLLASAVAMSMIMTIGSSVFAATSASLDTDYNATKVTSSTSTFYSFTPTVSGPYRITASASTTHGTGKTKTYARLRVYDRESTQGTSLGNKSANNTNSIYLDINMTAGTTYYIRPYGTSGSSNTSVSYTWHISKNFATISFDGNGSTSTMSSVNVSLNQPYTLPACTMTRTGYEFAGWATSATGSKEYDDKGSITPTGDITLYAVWNQIYTITFNANGGSNVRSQTGTAGTTITLPSTTRYGYHLMGWTEDTTSSTVLPVGSEYTITDSKTLTAVWGRTLTFNRNGGSGSIDPVYAVPGETIILPGVNDGISRVGATLAGWDTNSGSTNPRYATEAEYPMPSNNNPTLYAIWFYTLTFEVNGGSAIDPISRAYNQYVNLPSTSDVTRTGYGLRGWATSATATTPRYDPGARYQIQSSQTFYAIWGPQLSYDANGGEGAIATQTYANNATVDLKTASDGITRANYTLIGWSTNPNATEAEYALGQRIRITAPMTLYAVWGRNVSFASNGATETLDPVYAVEGTSITLPSGGLTRDGYTLAGWSVRSDGTTKDYGLGESYTVRGNVTLTAVWECTLSFDANGGTGDAMDDMTVIAGATVNLPACTYEYTTYSFAGWADTTTGTPSMTYTPSASTVMYAIWTARTVYNVNFDANGGEGTMASIPLTDDVTGTIPACEFTYTGFTFLGWTTDPESTTVDYVEGDPIGVVDSDVTLYALWSARDVYYVNFDANGGEGTMSPLALTDDVTGTIPACGFTRDGYTCIGWAVDADSETADYVQGDSIRLTNDNLTLYAVWEEGVTPGPNDPDDPDDPEVPDEPVYTPEQLREMNITHFVDNLYLVALERPYDVEGRDNWTNQLLVNGKSGSDIVYGFLNSSEFIGRNLSDEEYITLLYRIFFDREPDAEGMANWKKALAGGATRNDILRGFADSPEWLAYCARYQVNP